MQLRSDQATPYIYKKLIVIQDSQGGVGTKGVDVACDPKAQKDVACGNKGFLILWIVIT